MMVPLNSDTRVLDMGMKQIYIWWWGYSPRDLDWVEYLFIVATFMSTLTRSVGNC